MLHTRMVVAPVALAVGLISCVVAVAPVPGAEKVRLTRNASEVSTCSAVGNIKVNASGSNARTEFRNMEGSQPVRMSSRTRVRKSTSPNLGSVAISTSAKTPMCSLLAHYWICASLGISSLVPGRLQASASEPKKSRHPQRSGAAKVVTSSKRAGISADFSARHAASP